MTSSTARLFTSFTVRSTMHSPAWTYCRAFTQSGPSKRFQREDGGEHTKGESRVSINRSAFPPIILKVHSATSITEGNLVSWLRLWIVFCLDSHEFMGGIYLLRQCNRRYSLAFSGSYLLVLFPPRSWLVRKTINW